MLAAVLVVGTPILFFSALWQWMRASLERSHRMPGAFEQVIMMVTLPKEAADEKLIEKGIEGIREKIGAMDGLFSSLHTIGIPLTWRQRLVRRPDAIAFEIVAHQGLISFYVATPPSVAQHVEEQIHAQFSHAVIEHVDDYNMFSAQGVTAAAMLTVQREIFLPIRTYRSLDIDPLNAVTNAMSRLAPDEGVALQILLRPAGKRRQAWSARVAHQLQKGKKLRQAKYAAPATALGYLMRFGVEMFESEKSVREREQKSGMHKLSPLQEEMVKSLEQKSSKAQFDVVCRLVVSAKNQVAADRIVRDIVSAFGQYTSFQFGNGFKALVAKDPKHIVHDFIYRNFDPSRVLLLNTEELASLWHFPLPTTETPNIRWLTARQAAAPVNVPPDGLVLGKNIYRGKETLIRLKPEDRRRHVYIIGMTGSGKSALMAEMAKQDIAAGRGVAVIDPHGSLVDEVLASIPKERAADLIYFDPSDTSRPMGLNMLEADTVEQMDFAVQEMIAIFYKLVTDPSMIGPMFEHYMRNAMLTIMADRDEPGTIADIPRILTDKDFQDEKVKKLKDPIIRAFWEKELPQTASSTKGEMLPYLISKIGRFVENETMRNIIGQGKSAFDMRAVMDGKKILLANLSKGKVGEVNANLLGLILVSKLQMAALSRANMPEEQRNDFYLYVDEFQNFITDSISTILAEARKYRLNLIMAHQYIGQLSGSSGVEGKSQDTKIRDAVFGNVGTQICFRIGVEDAEFMQKQFAPVFGLYDLINIPRYQAYVRLLVDNTVTRPFHMNTFPPSAGSVERAVALKELSRLRFGRDKELVSEEIMTRSRLA